MSPRPRARLTAIAAANSSEQSRGSRSAPARRVGSSSSASAIAASSGGSAIGDRPHQELRQQAVVVHDADELVERAQLGERRHGRRPRPARAGPSRRRPGRAWLPRPTCPTRRRRRADRARCRARLRRPCARRTSRRRPRATAASDSTNSSGCSSWLTIDRQRRLLELDPLHPLLAGRRRTPRSPGRPACGSTCRPRASARTGGRWADGRRRAASRRAATCLSPRR